MLSKAQKANDISSLCTGPYSGLALDWQYAVAGIPYPYLLYLRDTGDHGMLLPPEYIEPTGAEVLEGIKAMAGDLTKSMKRGRRRP